MHCFRKALRLLAIGASTSSAASAQLPARMPASAEIRDVRYDITFDHASAAQRAIKVTTTFNVAGSGPVLLSLPQWTPGAYEVSNFARWVEDFAAKGDGRDLAWSKGDYDTWRVDPAGTKNVTVSFTYVADTLDNAMAWATPDFLLFNGTNVFLYAEGRPLTFTSRVTVHTEPEWRVVTGMHHETGNSFRASNYHDLVDMPFFVGRFDLDSAMVATPQPVHVTSAPRSL